MHRYDVYATRFDSLGIVDELVPARGLSFSMPLSDHGDCSFSATVEPGASFWRSALALPFSGVLIARDGVPWWEGIVVDERETGPRTFSFTAREWGWVFEEEIDAVPRLWKTPTNDHQIFRELIADAQAISGQDYRIELGTTMGAHESIKTDLTPWAKTKVGREFRAVSNAEGGPEWYFGAGGTLDAPRRPLVLGDRLGHVTPQAVLEHVEDTVPYRPPSGPPRVTLLGNLFPGEAPVVPVRRAGGNVIAKTRSRSRQGAATRVVATGDGQGAAQLRQTATAQDLIDRGWPRITSFSDYTDVKDRSTLTRHAWADLRAQAGITTAYSLVTLDGDPTADWADTPRGSTVQVKLDTDVYGGERPVGGPDGFPARCLNTIVRVPDSGPAQVEWQVADVLEVR